MREQPAAAADGEKLSLSSNLQPASTLRSAGPSTAQYEQPQRRRRLVRTASEEERAQAAGGGGRHLSLERCERRRPSLRTSSSELALSPREEGGCSAASTPTGAEPSADASPRFSYANNHSSGRQHLLERGCARGAAALARDGTLWGDTMIRTDAQGSASPSAWRRFDDILRSPRRWSRRWACRLGSSARWISKRAEAAAATTGCDASAAEEGAELCGRPAPRDDEHRQLADSAALLQEHRSQRPHRRALPSSSAAAAPTAEKRLSPSIASMFMSDANLPRSSSQGEARPRAPAAGSRIVAGGRKLE